MKKNITAGIDFGNETSVLSIPTEKGIEIILNESSNRRTPTAVCYQDSRRLSGEFAQQQQMMNITNTITQLKRLVGLQYNSQEQKNLSFDVPFQIVGLNDGLCGIKLENGSILRIEQIIGYYLKSLIEIIRKKYPRIEQFVLTVPSSWDEVQRRCIINSASISRIKIVELLNSSTASAISYVKIHGDRLPAEKEKSINVLFIELGDTLMNTSIAQLSKKSIDMKSNICDESIGGRYFTEILEKYLIQKVVEKYKIDPRTNKRSLLRFKQACEKAKKTLSSNPIVMFEVPSLMNDIDVSITIKREEFNELIKNYISKIKFNIEEAIKDAKIKKEDISYVEIVGGSSRIPLIKDQIKEIIGNELKMSLDLDECFAIGAGYLAAKVDGYNIGIDFISNKCPYQIDVRAENVKHHVSIFNDSIRIPTITKALIPIAKEQTLTFLCNKGNIGKAIIQTGIDQKVKTEIQIMMDNFGIIGIKDATFKVATENKRIQRYRCKSFKYLPFMTLSLQEIERFKEIEEKQSLQDKLELEIDNAKNELESLIFASQNELKSINQIDSKYHQQLIDKVNSIHCWFSDNEFERLNLNEYQTKIKELNEIMNQLKKLPSKQSNSKQSQPKKIVNNNKSKELQQKTKTNENHAKKEGKQEEMKHQEPSKKAKVQVENENSKKTQSNHQKKVKEADGFQIDWYDDPYGHPYGY